MIDSKWWTQLLLRFDNELPVQQMSGGTKTNTLSTTKTDRAQINFFVLLIGI